MTDEKAKVTLEDLGYDEFFKSIWKLPESANTSLARVISEHRESYKVRTPESEYTARITGRQMYNAETRADYPAVGDWVEISIVDEERAIINDILPRKTRIEKSRLRS